MRRIIVVGCGLAGLRAAETLRAEGFSGVLSMVGAEQRLPYDRPPLSKSVLSGEMTPEQTELRRRDDISADWLLGRTAVQVDFAAQTVHLDDDAALPYDALVIASGASPRTLGSIPGHLAGVMTLRTIEDALALRAALESSPRVVVIGAGLIGSELASTCRRLGVAVTLVDPLPMLHRVLGELSSSAAIRARRHGVCVLEGVAVEGVTATDDRVTGVQIADGDRVEADVVVVAIGAKPETRWLEGSGASLDDGVVCDATMAVEGVPNVVAAGDVARWPHPALGGALLRIEHWTNAAEQAAAAARRLMQGPTAAPYAPVPSFWTDQFGIRIQGVGFPPIADEVLVVEGDPAGERFVAEYRRTGGLVGAVVAGSPRALLPYRQELSRLMSSPLPT